MSVHALFDAQPAIESRFEEAWRLWPKKDKKALARAKYEAILRGRFRTRTLDRDSGNYVDIEVNGTEDQIIAGIKAYLASQYDRNTFGYKDGGRYIPGLGVFLNGGRFLDLL